MTDMTFDTANNRWNGGGTYCLISAETMHPDGVDAALVFKAPKAGTVTCSFSFSVVSDQSDGVVLIIKHNGEYVELGTAKNGGILIKGGGSADGEITLTVSEGDEIAFLINQNATTTYDATSPSVSIVYN